MTITIRNILTGDSIRSWRQSGTKASVIAKAHEYAVGDHARVVVSDGLVEVFVL